MRRDLLALWLCLGASAGLYWSLLGLDAKNGLLPVSSFLAALLALFALFGLAVRAISRLPETREAMLPVFLGAVIFRLALLPAGLPPTLHGAPFTQALADDLRGRRVTFERFQLYDDDLWRYLWDGHVLAHGGNPWAAAPGSALLDPLALPERAAETDGRTLWPDVRDNVNHPEVPTIYPPLAAALFVLSHALAPGSVLVWKLLVVALDLLAAVALAFALRASGQKATLALLYAWNPLVVKVFAGSGHVDALLVALLALLAWALLRRRHALAAFLWGAAVLAKLAPIVLLPLLWKRLGRRPMALALSAAVLGLLAQHAASGDAASGLAAFASSWRFNAGFFGLVESLCLGVRDAFGIPGFDAGLAARLFAGLALLLAILWLARAESPPTGGRPGDVAPPGPLLDSLGRAAATLGALVLLGPTVMPWYLTWLLPFAVLSGRREWLTVTGLVCFAFLVMIDGVERPVVLAVEHALVVGALFYGGCFHGARAPHAASSLPSPPGLARPGPGLALFRGPRIV